MKSKMTEEEFNLFNYLLDSPLTIEGICPEWYTILRAASRLHIAPWILAGEENTESVREFWKDKALTAVQVEFWVDEIKKKLPEWFEESFDPTTLILDQIKKKRSYPSKIDDDSVLFSVSS